jgi:hypothetical protein
MTQRLSGDVEVNQHFAQKHDFDTVIQQPQYKWSAKPAEFSTDKNKLQRALQKGAMKWLSGGRECLSPS